MNKNMWHWAKPVVIYPLSPMGPKEQLTLNVVLSEPGAFHGGGTAFWPQKTMDSALEESTQEAQM